MILGQRIRLDPNNAQATKLTRFAGAARFAWNWGLARWQEKYAAGEKPSWMGLNKELSASKNSEGSAHAWLREVNWMCATGALRDLGLAFQNFFRCVKTGQTPGYPRFKKRGVAPETFAYDGRQLRFDGRKVWLPKIGWVRMRENIRFPGKLLNPRVSKRAGHWYLSLQIEVDETRWTYPHRCETQAAVGVDLGTVDLAVLSDGMRVAAPRSYHRCEGRLRMLNKELSRRTKGGANRTKTRSKLAKLHERIANIRRDALHKLTAGLVKLYRWIGIEDLAVRAMAHGYRAKSILDAALAEFRRQVTYRRPWRERISSSLTATSRVAKPVAPAASSATRCR